MRKIALILSLAGALLAPHVATAAEGTTGPSPLSTVLAMTQDRGSPTQLAQCGFGYDICIRNCRSGYQGCRVSQSERTCSARWRSCIPQCRRRHNC